MNTMPLEMDTRILIDKSLENLGYSSDGRGKKFKHIYREQPRSEDERKKLGGKRADYVIYSKESETPIMIIEAKKKGEKIDKALEQGIHYAKALDAPIVFATDGVFCKSYHSRFDKTPLLNGQEIDEFIRESLALKYLSSWEVNTISPKVQYDRKTLINIFDEANNMLRGEGLRAGIERFGEFANILFLKLVSESEDTKRERGEQSDFDRMCHWDSIKDLKSSARIEYINEIVYKKLNALYKTEIFTPLQMRDYVILKEIIDKLDPLKLNDVDSDVKGDAFEYFLKESTASGNDLGEYFTPRHIVKTMVRLANPQIGEKIYDPFCGTGGLLIESFRHIWNTMARNPANNKLLRESTIYGNEITNTARITKMNMILAGDGHSNIKMLDSLANPIDGEYDVLLTNMPYSQKTKHSAKYDVPSNNGDSICVQHCVRAINGLSENGRMAIVVPEGFLFRKDLEKTREYLLDRCNLRSVISLPQGVFLPYTGVKTNILYCDRINNPERKVLASTHYWYFKVKNDGFTLDSHRRKIEGGNDLERYQEYRKLDEEQSSDMMDIGFQSVPFEKIKKNYNVLLGSRYRSVAIHSTYPMIALGEICAIERGASPRPINHYITNANDGINWIKIGDGNPNSMYINSTKEKITIEGSRKSRLVKKGDLILSNSMSYGRPYILNIDGCIHDGWLRIAANSSIIISKYLCYILGSEEILKEYQRLATGGVVNNLNSDLVRSIIIPVPPLDVQERILSELDGYQKIIVGARAVIENYRPVISTKGTYPIMKIGEVATLRPSKTKIQKLSKDTEVSFVPMSDINQNDISFEAKETHLLGDVISGYTYFEDGDILLSKITPCFENGKSGVAQNLINGIGFGSTEYIVIRVNTDVVRPDWIYYHVNSPEFLLLGKENMIGTAGQQRLPMDFVSNYPIPIPSLEQQDVILQQVKNEKELISPSHQIVSIFEQKIKNIIDILFN